MASRSITLYAMINGRRVTRDAVLDWEIARLPKAASKIGLAPPDGTVVRQRLAFADAKIALGAEETKRRLHRDLRIAAGVTRATARLSRGRRTMSVCELHVTGGSAAEFVQWFTDTARDDYVRSMIAANPDHFLIQTDPAGRQEVVETTGGSPAAGRFLIDYADLGPLVSPRHSDFPHQVAGVARTEAGPAIGGVRHEFRDGPGGFHARLCVEFPSLTAKRMIAEHRWHLAAEWANWIEFAFDGMD